MKLAKTLLIPYLKRFWLMFTSVIIVGAFGCGILIGLRNAYVSLKENIHSLLDECGYPDLYIETIGNIDRSYLSYLNDDFYDYMGIKDKEYRATYTTIFEYNNQAYSTRLIGYNDQSILSHHLIDGTLNENSVRMEYYFANSNHFKVGDKIFAKMPNGDKYEIEINATIVCPEASIVKADPYSISSSRDFAYIYVPQSIIDEHSSSLYFNQILFNFKDGEKKNIDESIELLKAYAKEKGTEITEDMVKQLRKNVSFATTYDDSEIIRFYNDAIKAINQITLLAPGVFFVVVLIVTILFLFQIVKQCRKDIGIMRALGEENKSISLVYLSLGLMIGVVSWIVGVGIGSIFTILANQAYGSALKLFPQPFILHPGAVFLSLALIVSVTLLTSYLASLNIAKIKPVEAMKALPPTNNNTPKLTKTLFKKAPITLKVTISQTIRNLRRYIMSGICLLCSGMLIFIALTIGESKNTMMSQLFDTRINYDVQVYFDNMPSEEDIDQIFKNDSNITGKTLIKYTPSELINPKNNNKTTGLINGIKYDQDLIKVVDDYQNIISLPNEGIVLSNHHAKTLDISIGDTILANGIELVVKNISNEYLYQVSYTSFDGYESDYTRGSLLIKVNNQDQFFNQYKDEDHITYISYTNVIKGEFNDRLAAFEISSRLLTFMAIVIGFMIVFNMMQTNLKEQKRTFATMRTLGYQRQSISMANLLTSLFQYVIAMTFAIPLGVLLSKGLLVSISTSSQSHPFPHAWQMYVFTIIFVLIFLLISHFLVMRKMKKWNLPESVKERE